MTIGIFTARHGTARHGMARHGTAQHGTARTARHGTARSVSLEIYICAQNMAETAIWKTKSRAIVGSPLISLSLKEAQNAPPPLGGPKIFPTNPPRISSIIVAFFCKIAPLPIRRSPSLDLFQKQLKTFKDYDHVQKTLKP